ncbi:MAG: sensor hybrid histidine kinase [Ramlibacter sp.]|nr:sensor hybrid histidine kinase [Ramlibacter sp.]
MAASGSRRPDDAAILEDLTRLNAELVNSQRELMRGNSELARLNAAVSEHNAQLESKVAERTAVLASQKALFQTLAENAPQVIWTIDGKTGELTFANRAWCALVGGTVADWSSRASRVALIHPDDRVAAGLNWQRSLQTLATFSGVRRLLAQDGSYRIMSYRGAPVLDAEGKAGFWVGIDTDVTELKEAEAALQRALLEQTRAAQDAESANRAKSTFLAAMSHDIRTPMNGVLGLLELLGTGHLAPAQRSMLAVAQESSRSLLRIVNDILDFSRIEADRLELDIAPASIGELVHRISDINAAAASVKGLLLHVHVGEGVSHWLHFDSVRVGQILNNLVGNAIKFTEQGKVTLRVELGRSSAGTEHLQFVVADTGIGISPDQQRRLFQPFMQASSETAALFGGSGLGLVICKRLAELMGGTVGIQSTPGQGTTVTAQLAFAIAGSAPASRQPGEGQAAPAPVVPRAAPTVAQAQAQGTLLLVVDDHPTNRMVLQRLANLLGYPSESAANGLLGLEAWKTGRFGAVLADCNMPEMDGYEMTRSIRLSEGSGPGIHTPVIACTAGALAAQEARCRAAGMDDYLVKPVTLATLGPCLSRWIPLPARDAATGVRS